MRRMINKFSFLLRTAGFGLCCACAAYMLYVAVSLHMVSKLERSGAKTWSLGVIAVTEGSVVRADGACVVIRYYHEWDGTDYQKVISRAIRGCQEGMRLPVVYSVGMGAGTCLTVGIYRKSVQTIGAAGAVMLLSGLIMNSRRRGKENGKKKDRSRKLEDEHDSQ